MSAEHLELPPAACPNGGVCMTHTPRLEEVEKNVERHDAALNRIGTDLDTVKKDVHEIRITLREKDQMMSFLRTVFLALLGCFASGVIAIIIQIGATVWWAGQLNTTMIINGKSISDHEIRLRSEEMDSAARRANSPNYRSQNGNGNGQSQP